ncbi:GntR family transcriptional regulator [Ponticoccus sp. SC2-23]|uniref:GntR family transcriptional regulator n=1 Tax=Alexandriicola marinus TaxID=2081710 RepID=UPI000FDA2505|nr:GntR family transcriptional regulator [Alexandriicola marinus]MBM1221381.1 GntR family transcriptional regulator [Ponticoccus sp. SC6-9]MBM1226422.1 GntR family transcriptional regulator [Ponticoccus sp. SC6-15]MBM1230373.1 GntR family transcriptional regulator [Ponticoccus sp. SC6-38]MBM1234896.1 GntR family transcriptional regulator [Ponticoccus sp. SC6-45]MBM1239394.1 GntR family transcriptional regulator [Ponticoccus sp. SC6-49]MBM1243176.1 GntR family transcriptional regulator [Pontic
MAAPDIAPLDQTKLRENAYFALRDAFTRGAFAPGDVLTLRDLAAKLGVSMTPVREAVRRLVAEGALVDTPSRKLMVPEFDQRRASDLLVARLAMEALALDQAMDRMSPDDVEALRQVLDGVPESPGAMPDLVTNHEFHFTLYRIGGSEVLLPIVEALWLQYGAYLNLIVMKPEASTIPEHVHHFELLDALGAGDRDAAHAALRADINRSFTFLMS